MVENQHAGSPTALCCAFTAWHRTSRWQWTWMPMGIPGFWDMFYLHCRKRATHISKTNLVTCAQHVSQKPRTSWTRMVDFTHQRASHISKTNFVTCLVFFRYVPFTCSQGTTYISKTNFATVFCTVLKVQCISKPRPGGPAIVVNVCCISQKQFVTCLVFEIHSWHKCIFLFLAYVMYLSWFLLRLIHLFRPCWWNENKITSLVSDV